MRASRIAGIMVVACVAILFTDYIVASRRVPQDDRLIRALQQQVKSDAAKASVLAAEQKRITASRSARKSRDDVVGWALILSAAPFFLSGAAATRAPWRKLQLGATLLGRANFISPSQKARATPPMTSEVDLAFVDELVAQLGRTQESAIIVLQAIQTHYRYLPDEALRRLCELTEITPAQVAGTSSFYGQFRRSPVGRHVVRVCHGTACHVAGARQVTDELRRYLAIPDGADTDPSSMFTLDEVACLGCCSLAPALMVDGHVAGKLTPAAACEALQAFEPTETA